MDLSEPAYREWGCAKTYNKNMYMPPFNRFACPLLKFPRDVSYLESLICQEPFVRNVLAKLELQHDGLEIILSNLITDHDDPVSLAYGWPQWMDIREVPSILMQDGWIYGEIRTEHRFYLPTPWNLWTDQPGGEAHRDRSATWPHYSHHISLNRSKRKDPRPAHTATPTSESEETPRNCETLLQSPLGGLGLALLIWSSSRLPIDSFDAPRPGQANGRAPQGDRRPPPPGTPPPKERRPCR